MYKKILFILIVFSFFPSFALASQDSVFEAKVLKVLEQKSIDREGGTQNIQQNLKLRGESGEWEDQEFEYYGISDIDVLSSNVYKTGDRVTVSHVESVDGEDLFFVLNHVRRGSIYWLCLLFVLVIILVARKKGLRSLLGLIISFLVILYFIVPKIIAGSNPFVIALLGSFVILLAIIYITEGWSKKSHIGVLSVTMSLIITYFLAFFFVKITYLTGFSSEESTFLISAGSKIIDFKGLLLAGILIGTLGVLDDVILGQIEVVQQIKNANQNLSNKKQIKLAGKVGRTHLGAMINTLFLTYAGASLPILILFYLDSGTGLGLSNVINSEVIATEIVRTLTGSIGLALSFPIATYLAVYLLKSSKKSIK